MISAQVVEELRNVGLSDDAVLAALCRIYAASMGKCQSKPYTPRYTGLQKHFHPPEKEWWPLRASVLLRDSFTCRYCGYVGKNPHAGSRQNPTDLTADHVVPLSRGGSNELDNLVCCCIRCNNSKSDKLISEWKGHHENGKAG